MVNMWLNVACLCLAISSCQALSGYDDVGNFSFDTDPERLLLTGKTGLIFSPGYDRSMYPSEITSGAKLINITYSAEPVIGYRFFVREFKIEEPDFLHIGSSTEVVGGFTRATRNTSLQYESGNVVLARPDMNISTPNGTFDLLNTTVFMDFYTTIKEDASRDSIGRFLIEYIADVDSCQLDYCENGGTCSRTDFGIYMCSCTSLWSGTTCGTNINECINMTTNDCHENADCTNNQTGSFNCKCRSGFTGNGTFCMDIDDCSAVVGFDPCNGTGDCVDKFGGFNCTCLPGYENGTDSPCSVIDQCARNNNCSSDATCMNKLPSFTCMCNTGFTGDGVNCTDLNECMGEGGGNNCHGNADCSNNDGSFTCMCKSGFTGNGVACTDFNECMGEGGGNNCSGFADCTNIDGGFTCMCKPGFSGSGVTCIDIDECLSSPCSTSGFCNNTDGSFICMCNTGFTGNGMNCDNINECAGTNDCHDTLGMCTDTDGSFTCSCKPGYTGNGKICDNINECNIATLNNCTTNVSSCMDTEGSFMCICDIPEYRGTSPDCDYYCLRDQSCNYDQNGFIDAPQFYDGTKLYDLFRETSWQFNGNWNGIRFRFINFTTETSEDFFSVFDVKDGQDIVAISGSIESISGLHNYESPITTALGNIANSSSSISAIYDNSSKSLTFNTSSVYVLFHSDRKIPQTGFKIEFKYDEYDCPDPSPCNNSGTCQDRAFTYQCVDCPGFKGKNCETDIDECIEGERPCDGNADCNNTIGGYNCTCRANFVGDGKTCNPQIIIDGLVTSVTVNSISINFDVTAMWDVMEYVSGFTVTYVFGTFTNTVNFTSRPIVLTGLQPNTPYAINITVIRGSSFGTSVVVFNLGSLVVTTAESVPANITNFNFSNDVKKDRITLIWEKPIEIGFGVVTHYEIQYAVDSSSYAVADIRGVSRGVQNFFINDDFTNVTIIGINSYLTWYFQIRAVSNFGNGKFSSIVTKYMGEKCPAWKEFSSRTFCDFRNYEGIFESENFPQPVNSDAVFNTIEEYWTTNVTTAFRLTTVYFVLFANESYVDVGYGGRDITDHAIEKNSTKYSFTNGVGPALDIGIESTITDNIVFAAYISDQTRRDRGFQIEMKLGINPCFSNPCVGYNLECNLMETYDFTCNCPSDYTGKHCDQPKVRPELNCMSARVTATSLSYDFAVQPEWIDDETVIGSYRFTITPAVSTPVIRNLRDTTVSLDSGLLPYTLYTVTMSVSGSFRVLSDVSMTASCDTRTAEAAPTVARNVQVVTNGLRSLRVTWQTPLTLNGVLIFDVTYTSTDHATYGETPDIRSSTNLRADTVQNVVNGLRDYRSYSVVVIARTGGGSTPADPVIIRTIAGPPREFIAVNVAMVMPTMALLSWTYASTAFPGPTKVYVVATSSLHGTNYVSEFHNTTSSSLQLTGLEEDQVYTLSLQAFTGTEPNTTRSTTLNTAMDVPGQVESFTVVGITTTFILLRWTPPTALDENGMITGYNISRTGVPTVTFDRDARMHNVTGLSPFTQYVFNIQAINNIGAGAIRTLTVTTAEAIPGSPSEFGVGSTSTATSIYLSWTPPEPVGNLRYTITVQPGGISTETSQSFVNITGLMPYTNYTIQLIAMTNAGSSAAVTVIRRTNEGAPTEVRDLTAIFMITTFSYVVTWNASATANGIISGYRIEWSGGTISGGVNLAASETTNTIPNLIQSSTAYTITCIATTGGGSSRSSISVTSPNLLPPPPTGLFVTPNKTTASITFDPPVTNIPISGYVVVYSQNAQEAVDFLDSDIHLNVEQLISGSPATVTGLKSIRTYNMSLHTTSRAGRRVSAASQTFQTLPEVPSSNIMYTIISTGSVFTVTFNASIPFQGESSYIVRLYQSNVIITEQTITSTLIVISHTVRFTGITGDTEYIIGFVASNSAGSSSEQRITVTSSPVTPTVSITSNFPTTLTVTITATSSVSGYVIEYIQRNCSTCSVLRMDISSAGTTEISGLSVGTSYSVEVYAVSSNGEGQRFVMNIPTQTGKPSTPNVNVSRQSSTSLSVSIQAPEPSSYVRNYTVLYEEVNCTSNCTEQQIIVGSNAIITTGQLIPIENLKIWTVYNIIVTATSDFDSTSTAVQQRTRVGTVEILDNTFTVSVSGATTTSTISVMNFCNSVSSIFDQSQGLIVTVHILVSGVSASANENITRYWVDVDISDPEPYVALSVCGTTSRRRKRQATNQDQDFQIGTDSSCTADSTNPCNGQLRADTEYNLRICGANEDSKFKCSQTTDPVRTQPVSSGLSAGEIAAIVICSILLLVLIILLCLYCYKRRKNTGKHVVSRRGHPNEGYDSSKSQQKYQVDPAADPQTGYSTGAKPDA